ncbi:MAG: thioredoxin family protein [Candidatus Freyarchaeota archaeon]|nr:thioredoxin family protein [Candidatus Jordarchaeia archaeon]MBS7268197.1 thioredoxin family protein [Candidatus Jordarchaeia archaeon]MBS7279456.1 thioredoxin family protein [Candidatus Jordarchaeia archaeon]
MRLVCQKEGSEVVTELKEEKFKEFVSSNPLVLVDFSATWCGPCRIQGKILDNIEAKFGNKIAIAKIDVDQNPNLARDFNIYAVPSLIFFYKGQPVVFDLEPEESIVEEPIESSKLVGVQSEENLEKIIEELLAQKDSK